MNLNGLCRTISVFVVLASTAEAFHYSHRSTWVSPKIVYDVTTPVSRVLFKKRSPPKSLYSWEFAATTTNPQPTFPAYGFKLIQLYRDKILDRDILKNNPSSRLIAIEENINRWININQKSNDRDFTTKSKSYISKQDEHWRYANKNLNQFDMMNRYVKKQLMKDKRTHEYGQSDFIIRNDENNHSNLKFNPIHNYNRNDEQNSHEKSLAKHIKETDKSNDDSKVRTNKQSHFDSNDNDSPGKIYYNDVKQNEEHNVFYDSNNNDFPKKDKDRYFKVINKEDSTIKSISDKNLYSKLKNSNEFDSEQNLEERHKRTDKPDTEKIESRRHGKEIKNSNATIETPNDKEKYNFDDDKKYNKKETDKVTQPSEEDGYTGKPIFKMEKTTYAGGLMCYSCDNLTSASCQKITPYTNRTVCSDIEYKCLIILTKNIFTDKITMRRSCGHKHTCQDLDSVATEIKMCHGCRTDLCNKSTTSVVSHTVFSLFPIIIAYLSMFR